MTQFILYTQSLGLDVCMWVHILQYDEYLIIYSGSTKYYGQEHLPKSQMLNFIRKWENTQKEL